jgi:nuclear pore complex protein Nup205
VHYFPPLAGFISRYGGIDGNISDARALNDRILLEDDEKPWKLPYVHAAFRAWWLAEYSGWYGENHDSHLPENQIEEGELTPMLVLKANPDIVSQRIDSALSNLLKP